MNPFTTFKFSPRKVHSFLASPPLKKKEGRKEGRNLGSHSHQGAGPQGLQLVLPDLLIKETPCL